MSDDPPATPGGEDTMPSAVGLRLFTALVALVAGIAAVVIAVVLVHSVLAA